ncbi:MAG TPA: response regulator [Thermoanaerobaculia bacterium]
MPRRLLVVDDEEPIRTLLSRILSRNGYEVECAVDGQDALDKLGEREFDGLILDLMMPRVDGFGVIKFLSGTRSEMLRHTVIVTAFAGMAESQKLNEVCHVLRKPFDIPTLLGIVSDCVDDHH